MSSDSIIENFMNTHPIFGSGDKNNFGAMSSSPISSSGINTVSMDFTLLQIIQFIFVIIAVYLAIKCKKVGNINILEIILAVLFAPFYIVFRFIRPCV